MGITYNNALRRFHLQSKRTSYVFDIVKSGYPAHVYWGKKIHDISRKDALAMLDRSFSPNPDVRDTTYSLDTLPQEYPGYGHSDFRTPAYHITKSNGLRVIDPRYRTHRIFKGKPRLEGLPATYAADDSLVETLEIELVDKASQLLIVLSYSLFEAADVLTRSVKFINEGEQCITLNRALSMSLDFPTAEYEMLHLNGSWANERNISRRPLAAGMQSIESKRGASSHYHNPFVALVDKHCTEHCGEVYGFSLVYSGNFLAEIEVDAYDTTRVCMGINPFDFAWRLEPGQSFQTPEAIMVYAEQGLNQMSQRFHHVIREHLLRGTFQHRERPILVNNWEATYFDFTEQKLLDIAAVAKNVGIELFVLDDGWFGKRNDDRSSLGDWQVNRLKLPDGLSGLAEKINDMGLQFGLWVEPEMVSVESELYRRHPDWCLETPDCPRSEGRNQLVLDLSRAEVCEAIIAMLSEVFSSANISYVKWDMNRNMTEIGSAGREPNRQAETAHRYMLGLYHILETLTERFPQILFESCAGGGGRFDAGMLYYMPQTWTSDNTDAVCRLKIQYGTSLVYPLITMGAHVSAVPNHQVQRTTTAAFRADVAMAGNFGYELDLTALSETEQQEIGRQVERYKNVRRLVQNGTFYRLLSPFEGDDTAWMIVNSDRSEALAFYYHGLKAPNGRLKRLKLFGLNPDARYKNLDSGEILYGSELMFFGVNLDIAPHDFFSQALHYQRTE